MIILITEIEKQKEKVLILFKALVKNNYIGLNCINKIDLIRFESKLNCKISNLVINNFKIIAN